MAQTFASEGQALPAATRFVVGASDFILNYWFLLLIGLAAIFVGFRYWRSTLSGALMLDRLKLRLPIVRFFARTNAIVQFCQTLGMLLESGVNLSESLDIVVNIVDNQVLAASLKEARDKIIKQGKIAPFLKETGIFPPMAIYLIKTGEESGELDTMLLTVAKNYETELSELTDSLTARLQPLMLILMAVVVGFIVMAVVQPMIGQLEFLGA